VQEGYKEHKALLLEVCQQFKLCWKPIVSFFRSSTEQDYHHLEESTQCVSLGLRSFGWPKLRFRVFPRFRSSIKLDCRHFAKPSKDLMGESNRSKYPRGRSRHF